MHWQDVSLNCVYHLQERKSRDSSRACNVSQRVVRTGVSPHIYYT